MDYRGNYDLSTSNISDVFDSQHYRSLRSQQVVIDGVPSVGGALLIGPTTGHARHLRKRTWGMLHDNYNFAYICMDRILRFCRNVMENLGLKTGIPCPDDKNHGDPRQPGILARKVQYHIMGRDVSGIFFRVPFPQCSVDRRLRRVPQALRGLIVFRSSGITHPGQALY